LINPARRTGGSGLGLAICREVLTALRGSIRISASSSEGTTVEIRIQGGSLRPADSRSLASGIWRSTDPSMPLPSN
jgi:K+-sensing histidine kinase KdpD